MKTKTSLLVAVVMIFITACQQRDTKSGLAERAIARYPVHEPNEEGFSNVRILAADTEDVHNLISRAERHRLIQPDSSIAIFNKAFKLSKAIGYRKGTVQSLYNIGICLYDQGNYRRARACFFSTLSYCSFLDRLENQEIVPRVYSSLGNTYFQEGSYDSAVSQYYKALTILQQATPVDTTTLMLLYSNMAAAMETLDEQYGRTTRYLFKAYGLAIRRKDTNATLITLLSNIAALYYKRHNDDSALFYLDEAFMVAKTLRASEKISELYTGISTVWLHKGNIAKAKAYLDSAIQVDSSHTTLSPSLLENLAHIELHQGHLESAAGYLLKALTAYDQRHTPKLKLNVLVMLREIYDSIGPEHLAYEYLKIESRLKDSILNEDRINSLNQMEVKYRASEKDKELIKRQMLIAGQNNRIQLQYLWIGVIVLALVATLALYYQKRQKAAFEQFKANREGEEKERLRMASELHDGIVSRLSAVKMSFDILRRSGMDSKGFTEGLQSLEQSIVEVRSISQNLQPSILVQRGLAAAIALYCQSISRVTALTVDFQLFGTLPPLKEDFQLNIYRIIQELVHNIVKHAQAAAALVQFNIISERLIIMVEDDGVGLVNTKSGDKNGIGLHNLHNRVAFLNGTMDITSDKGTSVVLEFDLKKHLIK